MKTGPTQTAAPCPWRLSKSRVLSALAALELQLYLGTKLRGASCSTLCQNGPFPWSSWPWSEAIRVECILLSLWQISEGFCALSARKLHIRSQQGTLRNSRIFLIPTVDISVVHKREHNHWQEWSQVSGLVLWLALAGEMCLEVAVLCPCHVLGSVQSFLWLRFLCLLHYGRLCEGCVSVRRGSPVSAANRAISLIQDVNVAALLFLRSWINLGLLVVVAFLTDKILWNCTLLFMGSVL